MKQRGIKNLPDNLYNIGEAKKLMMDTRNIKKYFWSLAHNIIKKMIRHCVWLLGISWSDFSRYITMLYTILARAVRNIAIESGWFYQKRNR